MLQKNSIDEIVETKDLDSMIHGEKVSNPR